MKYFFLLRDSNSCRLNANVIFVKKECIMKTFECGTLVPGCKWKTSHENEAEIVQHAVQHLKSIHNEHHIRPSIVAAIKQRVKDEDPQVA
jgi:predicted small metal-binding protein